MKTTTRRPSLFAQAVDAVAECLARDPLVPPENRDAYRQAWASVIRGGFAQVLGGERFYVPSAREAREAARQRILSALAAGEAPADIARRERVKASWVRKLKQRGA